MEAFFGRTELEWEELETVGWELLIDCTVALTTYSELNKNLAQITGQPPWNFGNPADRDAMAHLLGRLADRSYGDCIAAGREPVMISAVCKFLNKNDAGDGFYGKARDLGLMSDGMYKDRSGRIDWWAVHVGKVQDWLKERRAVGG